MLSAILTAYSCSSVVAGGFDERHSSNKFTIDQQICIIAQQIIAQQDILHPKISQAPVLGDGSEVFTPRKNGVFTFLSMQANVLTIFGSVHMALRYQTMSPAQCCFISLPQAILEKGVIAVHFVNKALANPINERHDVCVVQVIHGNDAGVIPTWQPINLQGHTRTFFDCSVVGKSLGSYVSNAGGLVAIKKDHEGFGTVKFLVDQGEPGDSGTLLFMEDPTTKDRHPVAIFNGPTSASNKYSFKGQACLIPPSNNFVRYTAIDGSQVPTQCSLQGVNHLSSYTVHSTPNSPSVSLQENGGNHFLTGVFIGVSTPFTYMGDRDINMMNSYFS